MSIPINTTVHIKVDDNGRPSTDALDVVKLSQQILLKSVLEKTENGASLPSDMSDLQSLIRDLSTNAQLSRKLDIEENIGGDATRLTQAYLELRAQREASRRGLPPPSTSVDDGSPHPLDAIAPPVAELAPGEGDQGPQIQIADDYIDVED